MIADLAGLALQATEAIADAAKRDPVAQRVAALRRAETARIVHVRAALRRLRRALRRGSVDAAAVAVLELESLGIPDEQIHDAKDDARALVAGQGKAPTRGG